MILGSFVCFRPSRTRSDVAITLVLYVTNGASSRESSDQMPDPKWVISGDLVQMVVAIITILIP